MKHTDLISEKEQEHLYLIHHMHHYLDKGDVIHELHHCFLFSQPDMKGDKYEVSHLFVNNNLHHIIKKKTPDVLYDHANNLFKITQVEINGKIINLIV